MDVKHAGLVITSCCVLHNFCGMNHDIRCIGPIGMQDPYPNLNVNIGFPTTITSEQALSRKKQRIRNSLFKYWQENERNQ